MNNFKKIGMTALAASLVSVSAQAADLSVTGSASINAEGFSDTTGRNAGTTFSMGNSVYFKGNGELDNGLNVAVSYELDQGNADGTAGVFDDHSVTVSSDTIGSLTFAGHGGKSATGAVDTTAAGDLWDAFDGEIYKNNSVTLPDFAIDNSGTNNSFLYKSPDLMDGLNVSLSYNPQGSGAASETGAGINFTGVEGLSLHYAQTDVETGTSSTSGDNTVMKAEYAIGSFTLGYSNMHNDVSGSASTSDIEVTSYAVSYTVSDELSISYGTETADKASTTTDAETAGISAAYTSGGMTVSVSMTDGENMDFTTDADGDLSYWSIGTSYAF